MAQQVGPNYWGLWQSLRTIFDYNEDKSSTDLMDRLENIEMKKLGLLPKVVDFKWVCSQFGCTTPVKVAGNLCEEHIKYWNNQEKEMPQPKKKTDKKTKKQVGDNFYCPNCEFKTASKQGLSIHMGSMHKGSNLKKGVLPERSSNEKKGIISNTPINPPKTK